MGVKTMKAGGCTLPLPLEQVGIQSHAGAAQGGLVFKCRRLLEEKDWEDVALRLERPMDVFCWVAVTAAVIVLVPLCIRLLAG
ncbi:MAG TPA: hypothetical protein PLR20_13200 [Syntrophales bacterium]|nr:hypothetical protein [Syntrophales bacterium]HPI56709.1 hypothetical protein [Syntrophales bacterium]HPN24866.1 hypothetical protein [Syntrophales bacterium]HQM30301.1 hypothetical protein [Syntrophales bacterium]